VQVCTIAIESAIELRVKLAVLPRDTDDPAFSSSRLAEIGLEQAQPHLADGGVGGHRVPEAIDRYFPDDGDRRRVEELADILANECRADDDAAIFVDDELGSTRVVVGVEC
jgi:hypothetical protein